MIYFPSPELPYPDTLNGIILESLWYHAWRNYSMLEYMTILHMAAEKSV